MTVTWSVRLLRRAENLRATMTTTKKRKTKHHITMYTTCHDFSPSPGGGAGGLPGGEGWSLVSDDNVTPVTVMPNRVEKNASKLPDPLAETAFVKESWISVALRPEGGTIAKTTS